MHTQLSSNVFRIEVPIPGSPLRAINSYLFKGMERNILIDNGFNMEPCAKALTEVLEQLCVDLTKTDFFLTHLHGDHNGLTAMLQQSDNSQIWCSAEDGRRINEGVHSAEKWLRAFYSMEKHGFPLPDIEAMITAHPGKRYGLPRALAITPVKEGDVIDVHPFSFTVIEVPGHTPGHVSLLEKNTGFYVSGDHILGTITPNITNWDGVEDSLAEYLNSLDKIKSLNPVLTLPGHRDVVKDTAARVDELKLHHQMRLQEIEKIVKNAPADAYTVAGKMVWSIRAKSWEDFPVQQRWFACGEALAHLEYLTGKGRLKIENAGAKVLFSLR